ncbi:putative F420-dependent oxidoreductase [Nocardia pseudobrasiliensis]|uniref:Putative F420-dependent oxidoreductase n=2 Tax=Nocardia pseudobrasiliensis TaxID=45979 RepID=A0A370IAW8_9NOCA|nr:putative F420-dependent oxidoreductase [Nocardia pseudobrasiliensis]
MEALRVAAAADDLGYDRLWVGEMATFDAFALATAIGREPGRIPLCVGPLAVDVRTPAGIAIGVASVAALTGRRVDIALGSSSTVVVRDWHGRERRRTAQHLAESARIVRDLLAGRKADFDGAIEHTHGYRLRLPAPRTEIVMAAFGPRTLAAAAHTADRVVLNLLTPQQLSRCVEQIRASAPASGDEPRISTGEGSRPRAAAERDPRSTMGTRGGAERVGPPVSVWVTAALDPTAQQWATARRGVIGYLRAPGYDAMFAEAGFGELVSAAHAGAHPRELFAAMPDELLTAVGIFGDEAAMADRLAAYYRAGADEVVIVPVTTADDPGARRTLSALKRIRERLESTVAQQV